MSENIIVVWVQGGSRDPPGKKIGLDAIGLKKKSTTDLCQTCNFSPN